MKQDFQMLRTLIYFHSTVLYMNLVLMKFDL